MLRIIVPTREKKAANASDFKLFTILAIILNFYDPAFFVKQKIKRIYSNEHNFIPEEVYHFAQKYGKMINKIWSLKFRGGKQDGKQIDLGH